jgi:DNA (cytosine-5)-methyltransferase 1
MESCDLDQAPIHDDVRTIGTAKLMAKDGTELTNVECVLGGFPCQDISGQGKKSGLDGDKSSLFYNIIEAARRFNPNYIILENVHNILSMTNVWRVVLRCLHDAGFAHVRWATVSAADVGAPHLRKRVFFLARRVAPDLLHGGIVLGLDNEARPFNAKESNLHETGARINEPKIPRFINATKKEITKNNIRFRQLGNIVCVPQGRLAIDMLFHSCGVIPKKVKKLRDGRLPDWGYSQNGVITVLQKPVLPKTIAWPTRTIIPPPVPEGVDPAVVLTEPWVRPRYPTPTCGGSLPTKRLTKRRIKDVGSAVYYDSQTTAAERGSIRLNPQYVEWMQGLRPGYTCV